MWNAVSVRPMMGVSLQEIHGHNGEESMTVRNVQKWKKSTAEARVVWPSEKGTNV